MSDILDDTEKQGNTSELSDMVEERNTSGGGDSDGGGSKRSGRRGNVIFPGIYGSVVLPPDTSCGLCSINAEGVVIERDDGDDGGDGLVDYEPMCRQHREQFEESQPERWEAAEYKTF